MRYLLILDNGNLEMVDEIDAEIKATFVAGNITSIVDMSLKKELSSSGQVWEEISEHVGW